MRTGDDRASCDHQAVRGQVGLAFVMLILGALLARRLGLRCPIRAAFGIDCPGCGGTRALLALIRGNPRQAARENLAAVLVGPAVAGYLIAPGQVSNVAETIRDRAERHVATRWWARHPQLAACAATGLWCVARNTLPPMRAAHEAGPPGDPER
jgi:hypothetical protein